MTSPRALLSAVLGQVVIERTAAGEVWAFATIDAGEDGITKSGCGGLLTHPSSMEDGVMSAPEGDGNVRPPSFGDQPFVKVKACRVRHGSRRRPRHVRAGTSPSC
jgi:hypothetical protein